MCIIKVYIFLKDYTIRRLSLFIFINALLVIIIAFLFMGSTGFVGSFGARLSELNRSMFGYIAYVYPLVLLYINYSIYRSRKITIRRVEVALSIILAFVVLVILQGLVFPRSSILSDAVFAGMERFVGIVGIVIVMFASLILSILMAKNPNIESFFGKCGGVFDAIFENLKYKIGNIFSSRNSQKGIIGLEEEREERTIDAKYDFKDVDVDENFEDNFLVEEFEIHQTKDEDENRPHQEVRSKSVV